MKLLEMEFSTFKRESIESIFFNSALISSHSANVRYLTKNFDEKKLKIYFEKIKKTSTINCRHILPLLGAKDCFALALIVKAELA